MQEELSFSREGVAIFSPSGCSCPGCYFSRKTPFDISLTSVESVEDGWIAYGRGARTRRRCPGCGVIYEALMQQVIPIYCGSFPCPKCNDKQNLEYRIHRISANQVQFEFEVLINCKKCSKKNSIKKVLSSLLGLLNIEVRPTGITVNTSGIKKKY